MMLKTIKVMPWGSDQGDFVLINAVDYDPKTHKLYEVTQDEKGLTVAELKKALDGYNVGYSDNAKKADLQLALDIYKEQMELD